MDVKMKNLVKELNNKMAGRELIYLSTFVNSKKSMSSRIEFKKIELKALNGYISIATNGSQIVRVFFKGRYFSVDALWDIERGSVGERSYEIIYRITIIGVYGWLVPQQV